MSIDSNSLPDSFRRAMVREPALKSPIPSPESVMRGMKTRAARGFTSTPRGSWRAAWREIGGKRIFARSRWEANYARYLQFLKERGQIADWEHEPETFWFEAIKRGCRSYLPDFRITCLLGTIEYHEVKGWMDERSITKIKRMAKYFPAVVLIVRDKEWFRANQRKLRGLIPGWEHRDDGQGPRLEVEVS